MNCHYCKKEITGAGIDFNKLVFCNNLCKYMWEKEAESPVSDKHENNQKGLFLENLDFELQIDGFEDRNLLIRGSYWRGARLFIDGKPAKPVEKKYFKRTRKFILRNNYGYDIEIIFKNRFYDAIPSIKVNGYELLLDKKLTWFDYIFISSPAILIFAGGILGVIIGWGAVFTNSVLFRKTNKNALKYFFVIVNSIIAFTLFIKIVLYIAPYTEEFRLKFVNQLYSNSEMYKKEYDPNLSGHVWQLSKITTIDGKDITDYKSILYNNRNYFIGGGDLTQILRDGSILKRRWKLDNINKILTVTTNGKDEKLNIISITETEFIYQVGNMNFIYKAM